MKACNQCGKCCVYYSDGGLVATQAEIQYWKQYQPNIAAYVHEGQIWIDPESKKALTRCPWLRQGEVLTTGSSQGARLVYSCGIYDYRPADCRHYPVTINQMKKDDCEMLEASDLKRPKRAQRQLETLMAESRTWSIEMLDT